MKDKELDDIDIERSNTSTPIEALPKLCQKSLTPSEYNLERSTTSSLVEALPKLCEKKSATSVLAHVSSRLTTRSITDPGSPPDGGLQAWIQVVCAWLALANTWGFVNSFGAFQTYYATIISQSPSNISWIGSIQTFLLFALGMFSGRALDAGYFRPTVTLGILIQLLGIFTMSVSKTYWQLLLTHGICTGLGGGIFFVPVLGVCSTYFAKRRGMAMGIVTSGNAAGGIIYPVVVRQMLYKVGFGWTVRVLGFINIASLAVVIAFMKPRLRPRKSGPCLDMESLKDIPYIVHVLGMCFLMPAVYFVFYYIASFARDELSMSYTKSLNLVVIVNGVGVPARILPGIISDRCLGVMNTVILCVAAKCIVLWCWLAVSSTPSYYIFTVFYGVFCAAYQSLFPTTIAALSNDITKTGTRLGMAFTAIGFSALVGAPLAGAILKVGGGYMAPIIWASVSSVCGTGLVVCARGRKWGWRWSTRC